MRAGSGWQHQGWDIKSLAPSLGMVRSAAPAPALGDEGRVCRVSAGRMGALAGTNTSSSPFHPSPTLLSLLADGNRPARSPRGSVRVPKASSYFQALTTDRSCCILQGWTGSTAASHKPLMAGMCLSPGLAAARLVLESRSHLKLQGSGLQSCPPSLTKAIQTLCLAGDGRANTPPTTPHTATLPQGLCF